MIRSFMTSGEAYDFYKIIKNETKTVGQIQKFDPEQKTQITKKNLFTSEMQRYKNEQIPLYSQTPKSKLRRSEKDKMILNS